MALNAYYPGTDAGTITTGQRKLSDLGASTAGRDVPQWVKDTIINVSENVAPFTAMLDRMGTAKKFYNPAYNHLEGDDLPNVVEIATFVTDGDGTGINLDTGQAKNIKAGQTLYVPRTGEVLFVSSVDSTTALTVTRGFGSSSPTTLVAGEDLYIGAMADTEGNTAPAAISSEPTIKTNYLQTTKKSIELSGRLLASGSAGVQGGAELARLQGDAIKAMRKEIEVSLFHGARYASNPTATGGIDYYLSSLVTNIGGVLTEAATNTFIKTAYRRNQDDRSGVVLFAGELVMDAFDGFGRDNIRYSVGDKVAGVAIGRYITSHGELAIKAHPMLAINTDTAGRAYFLNMKKIAKAEYANRGFIHKPNVEAVSTDGRKDYWLSDFGLWLAAEKCHGTFYGVTG